VTQVKTPVSMASTARTSKAHTFAQVDFMFSIDFDYCNTLTLILNN